MNDTQVLPIISYVIVADKHSPFLWWAIVSMLLVRDIDKSFVIVLCTDDKTLAVLNKSNHPLLGVVDDIKSIKTFDGTLRERSRWVKTNLRLMLKGDIVYLDSDAIPIHPFDEVYRHSADIALTENIGGMLGVRRWYEPACKELGWAGSAGAYFSSGVFFLRDNDQCRRFGELWKEKWLIWRLFDKSGISADQPAFNSAITEANLNVLEIHTKFNIALTHPLANTEDPRIFHYPASIRSMKYSSLLSNLARKYKKTGRLDYSQLRRAKETLQPWVLPMPFVWVEYFASALGQRMTRKIRRIIPAGLRRNVVK